jgi:adenine-specific DNA-methyltransferase
MVHSLSCSGAHDREAESALDERGYRRHEQTRNTSRSTGSAYCDEGERLMSRATRPTIATRIDALRHQDTRVNIPTEELRDFVADDERAPKTLLYPRDPSLDPQLVWKGKDEQDQQDLAVLSVPIYIQEKIDPRAIVEDVRGNAGRGPADAGEQLSLFADFDGEIAFDELVDFYQHAQNWSNRMILGDSLLVMASLAEKEGLKGQVQTIYLDPPYGIKFGSNWQVSTRKRDVKDGRADDLTRQPEQIKAFRDTWQLGIHSYLTYLRDRLVVARELLTESGSIFVQIGDENVHLVRSLLDEVFGSENFVSVISFAKTTGFSGNYLSNVSDYLVWYAKDARRTKYRALHKEKQPGEAGATAYRPVVDFPTSYTFVSHESDTAMPLATSDQLTSQGASLTSDQLVKFQGRDFHPPRGLHWKTTVDGVRRIALAGRIFLVGNTLRYLRFLNDFPVYPITNTWVDTGIAGYTADKFYVVQTLPRIVERCLLMTTDPGDLVLDPTCGSGTTAYVAEQWGRRWITIDTSRVALALARTRLMAGRYPYYLLADSDEGRAKEREVSGVAVEHAAPAAHDVRKGFVYRRVPHITLKSIANNEEIDAIHARYQEQLEPLRARLNALTGQAWEEWEVPRELPAATAPPPTPVIPSSSEESPAADQHGVDGGRSFAATAQDDSGKGAARDDSGKGVARDDSGKGVARDERDGDAGASEVLARWWQLRRERQREIDASIARRADTETLFDQPYEDTKRVRVTGPFTVESLSPHRVLSTDEERPESERSGQRAAEANGGFVTTILDHLRKAGVQNTVRDERLAFERLEPFAGEWLQAAGDYTGADGITRRVAVSVGPEHGTVGPEWVKEAAKEALRGAGFDLLVILGFAFDAHSGETAREFSPSPNGGGHGRAAQGFVAEEARQYGKLPVLLARMNPDLLMGADLLKNTGAGNLFMVFGEPDVEIRPAEGGQLVVEVRGVDVYVPTTGEIRSSSTDEIACWFIDTAYNGESFFVRHAYFTGADQPYDKLKRALRAEIDEAAWAQLYSTTSRPFPRPASGKIAIKVINHYGDEVLKVYAVDAS